MPQRIKAVPLEDSDSEPEDNELVQKRVKLIRELSELERPPETFRGGIKIGNDCGIAGQSTSVSLSAAEKRGLKEVEELERELDLKNTFSEETNRRDEDAEMNKYIDEQIKLVKRKGEDHDPKNIPSRLDDSEITEMFHTCDKVDDILLNSLSKNQGPASEEKSEAMLSNQMLNGIPEVDLGIKERIRTIEALEEAKLKLASRR